MEQPIELVFSTHELSSFERRAYWNDKVSEQWQATTFEWIDEEASHGKVIMHSFAGSLSAECENASARIARPKRLIQQAPDCYNLVLHLDGGGVSRQGGREIAADTGDLILMAATEPFEMILSRHHVRSWALPRRMLDPLLRDPATAVNALIPGRSVLGGLLGTYLGTLWQSFGKVDLDTAVAFDRHLHQLVALALGGKKTELDEPWDRRTQSAHQLKHTALDVTTEQARRAWVLRERYGLTRAEAAFALEIVKGDGRDAAARRRGISVSTAHSHLTRIFEKTGVHRQAELVHLLMMSWMDG